MNLLSVQQFSANGFRVLGLPAGASQADIDAAARRMRLWSDPAAIPPTPMDVPWLGTLGRGRTDIEHAVATLADPQSRLEQRLFWFMDPAAAAALGPAQRKLFILSGQPSAPPGTPAHDISLAQLAGALLADPHITHAQQWSAAVVQLAQVGRSAEYRQWFARTEADGDFEKIAADYEISSVLDDLPAMIAHSLATRARDALDRGQAQGCVQLLDLIRTVRQPGADQAGLETGIADRIEDLLTTRCERHRDELYRGLNWNRPKARTNRVQSRKTQNEIDQEIEPLFAALKHLPDHHERLGRISANASRMYRNLGLGWGMAGKKAMATEAFVRGRELAAAGADSAMHVKLTADLKNLSARPAKKASPGRAAIIIVGLLGGIIRAFFGDNHPMRTVDPVPDYHFLNNHSMPLDRAAIERLGRQMNDSTAPTDDTGSHPLESTTRPE